MTSFSEWLAEQGIVYAPDAIEIDLLRCVTVLLDCGIGPGARPGIGMEANTSTG